VVIKARHVRAPVQMS